jgi:hypothetical protein
MVIVRMSYLSELTVNISNMDSFRSGDDGLAPIGPIVKLSSMGRIRTRPLDPQIKAQPELNCWKAPLFGPLFKVQTEPNISRKPYARSLVAQEYDLHSVETIICLVFKHAPKAPKGFA